MIDLAGIKEVAQEAVPDLSGGKQAECSERFRGIGHRLGPFFGRLALAPGSIHRDP